MTRGRVLVTGAAGRLGRHVVARLAASGWSITALIADGDDTSVVTAYADRLVEGNASDPDVARRSAAGVGSVVHLAAIAAPGLGPPEVVFGQNSLATFCVLDAASNEGATTAVLASSLAALGLAFSPHGAQPTYVPLDEASPTQSADPYSLSKIADEATAAMMSRRSAITTTALRFPFLGGPDDRFPQWAERYRVRPRAGRSELWGYLDTRDAAMAVELALARVGGDSMVISVAAPDTMAPYATEDLLDAFLPHVARRRPFVGREVPIDLTRSRDVLGFAPVHLWPLSTLNLADPASPTSPQETA